MVDDDCVDVMCAKRVLHELGVTNEVVCAANGEEALAYLNGRESEMPCVILTTIERYVAPSRGVERWGPVPL